MGGGLMQLVAYGAQDIYLTGNPQITFFKVVYRRHTNFSMECIEQSINGTPVNGGKSSVTISRNGDLISKIYVTLNQGFVDTGSDIVSQVELEIGGQLIDRQDKEWNHIWWELTTPASKQLALKSMICDIGRRDDGDNSTMDVGLVQIPLNFWFCRNPGLALPLIALQYHEVDLKFTWGSSHGGTISAVKIVCDYIYLDTDERRRFAQVSHEYLIEQIQKQSATAAGSSKLTFNHPVKELIWTSSNRNTYGTAKLVLNGHDRFSPQEEEYFQLRQPYEYHTSVPHQNLPHAAAIVSSTKNLISHFGVGVFATFRTLQGVDSLSSGEVEIENTAVLSSGRFAVSACADDEVDNNLFDGAPARVVTATAPRRIVLSFLTSDIITSIEIGTNLYISYSTEVGGTGVEQGRGVRATVLASGEGGAGADNYSSGLTHIILDRRFDNFNNTVDQSNFLLSNVFSFSTSDVSAHTSKMTTKINVYSFALKPEEHQPSGTCNFSRIDDARLEFGTASGISATDNIYAVNYNILRIMSGMGGLAYSN